MAVPQTVTVTAKDPVTGLSGTGSASCHTNMYVGCTTASTDYPNATYLSAAQQFNALTGTSMGFGYQKHYLTEGQVLTSVPARITQLAPFGCRFGVCFQPSRTVSAQEQANLLANLNLLEAAGVKYDAILWNEPQGDFTTAAAYKSYCDAYAPVIVQAGVNLVYNGIGDNMTTCLSYFPGDQPAYDWYAVTCDLYATGYLKGGGGDYLKPLYQLANSLRKKFGVLEFGPTAGANPVMPTQQQFSQFAGYLINCFMTSINYPYALGYFNQDNKTGAVDTVETASDPWIPGLQAIWSALKPS